MDSNFAEYDFEEIRAYTDLDYEAVIKKLLSDKKKLKMARKFFKPGIPPVFAIFYDLIFIKKLRHYLGQFSTIKEFQEGFVFKVLLEEIIKRSIKELSFSGFENLNKNEGYFFISNHRDILLDSCLLNYILIKFGIETTQLAFGNNLIVNDFIGHFVRINKGFIVKRNLSMREQLRESEILSAYINKILSENQSIWIAQRDGRAKDGCDKTKPTVLKMVHLANRRKKISFADDVKRIRYVPVSVSYEYDPCDIMKANELYALDTENKYEKHKYEDLKSIIQGITGQKSRVHIAVGHVVDTTGIVHPEDLAIKIDEQIHQNYKLWPSNFIAFDILNNTDKFTSQYNDTEKAFFIKRMNELEIIKHKFFLIQYANPVINHFNLVEEVPEKV